MGLTYEAMFGLQGGWDQIEEDGAADSVDLLCTFVERLLDVQERLGSASG